MTTLNMSDLAKEITEKASGLGKDQLRSVISALTERYKQYRDRNGDQAKKREQSRWAVFAEEINNDQDRNDPAFQESWAQIKKDTEECRNGFNF